MHWRERLRRGLPLMPIAGGKSGQVIEPKTYSRYLPGDVPYLEQVKKATLAGLTGEGPDPFAMEEARAQQRLLSAAQKAGVLSSTGMNQTGGLLAQLGAEFGAQRAQRGLANAQNLLGLLAGQMGQPQYQEDPFTSLLGGIASFFIPGAKR